VSWSLATRSCCVPMHGLTEMVADDWIAAVLEADHEPRTACERLVAEANEFGGKDNISVIVPRFDHTRSC
jgi:serine/threonine protein phosphatase PrpC